MRLGPALIEGGRLNPGYLKLDLYCRGLRVAPDLVDAGLVRRVRAGLGSGLELCLSDSGMYVNAPVHEAFAHSSPYALRASSQTGSYDLLRDGRALARVAVAPAPRFYGRRTTSGKRMDTIGTIQGTYLGIYYGGLCANWKAPSEDACRFCGLGHSGERTNKTAQDVIETALAAREELRITFVHVNGGFDDREGYVHRFLPLMRRLRDETGLLSGLQLPPLADPAAYHAIREAGVNNVSLCFELWNDEAFTHACPGKARRAGLDRYRESISYCARDVGFDTTNGELIAGLEDPAASMAAIDWLTDVGAIPTVCVFRPLVGTPLENRQPPRTEEMVPVFAHTYRRCIERGLPIGVAPDLRVSIVLTPDECRWLLPPSERERWKLRRLKHAAMRRALGWRVRRRVRKSRAVSP